MKKLIFLTLLFATLSVEPASGGSVRPQGSYENYNLFVQDVKKIITIERPYKIETEESFALASGQTARLDFEANPAGIVEFIFFCNHEFEKVHIIYRCTDDEENDYAGTSLRPEKLKDFRVVGISGAEKFLNIFSAWKPEDGKAFIKFRTTMSLSEEDQEEISEINEARRQRKAKELDARLKAVTKLGWDTDEIITPLKIIMDDPNDPNMIKLREKYGLDELISNANDDYERLRLITEWVQKQWKHRGNNKPSRADPLTILKEASEGKRFRCVEYATVVAGCARSLGMPSRVLALKRSDVETAKSSAGHIVAEVWLERFNKWVFVDGQWGVIPEANGVPLNAVEFQDAIACELPGLKIRFTTTKDEKNYLAWVAPYLYYFDYKLDQRFFNEETEDERITGSKGKIMLVPKGANKPKVFQRKYPIKNCTYISNPNTFYPQVNK